MERRLGVAWRTLKNALTNPQIFLPTMLFPLFFFTAFAGASPSCARFPASTFRRATPPSSSSSSCSSPQRSAASSPVSGSRDFEGGFGKRLLLAAPHRSGIVFGYALAALVRWLVVAAILTVVAVVAGMQVGGGPVDLVGLYILAILVNFCGFFWSGGSLRFRTSRRRR